MRPLGLVLGNSLASLLGYLLPWSWDTLRTWSWGTFGVGRGWRRGDMDDFGTGLGVIPRERGGILHCQCKIFSVVVSVLFRGKCVQLWGMF